MVMAEILKLETSMSEVHFLFTVHAVDTQALLATMDQFIVGVVVYVGLVDFKKCRLSPFPGF